MTQSSEAKNTFFSVTLYHFQKRGRAIALPAPPSLPSLGHLHRVRSRPVHLILAEQLTLVVTFKINEILEFTKYVVE